MAKKTEEEIEKPFDFETFELKTLEDFKTWNYHAHKAFREAKKANPKSDPPIPVKVPDESFHKKIKVRFQRMDQPENVLKVRCRTSSIDWRGELIPGRIYDLPMPVIQFLSNLATPVFAEVKVDGPGETRVETQQVGERSRFSCQFMEMYENSAA